MYRLAISVFAIIVIALSGAPATAAPSAKSSTYDVVVYGGTSAGIIAAIQAKKMGKSVVVLEQTIRVGGLTTGGLGATDCFWGDAIGGLSRSFYEGIYSGYHGGKAGVSWKFAPSDALRVFHKMIEENGIDVVYKQLLDRENGVKKDDRQRITSIAMESGETYIGKAFIDATYEGDLMAAAGVEYIVGRESNAKYGERKNGVQVSQAYLHQFSRTSAVDPYIEKGNPSSGLLPFIDPKGPGEPGQGDHRVQAYCFRMCLTDVESNRIPFKKPAGYNELWYELLFRNYEAGSKVKTPWHNQSMPGNKTDTNNSGGLSTDFVGQNYDYPEASHAEREAIVKRHLLYQQGLMWTLANHPRVPKKIRDEVSQWGTCKDEFVEFNNDGWQRQLYIRVARRMVSDLVYTEHHIHGRRKIDDPVGLGTYNMDSHNVQRHLTQMKDGKVTVRNEGDCHYGVKKPYPISYRVILPKKNECQNLLVPACVSASHIAYGSLRMEPTFMILGQAAGTAAVIAIDDNVAVQDVKYEKLKMQLLKDRQILVYTGTAGPKAVWTIPDTPATKATPK